MAYSNTVSQTVFTTQRVIDNAVRRCRIPAEQITSEAISIANDMLYLLLSDLANQGVPLWCIQKCIYPLYEGTPTITTYTGTVDLLNTNLRTLQGLTGTNTDTSTTRTVAFSSATAVSTVGILWSAASVPVSLQRSTDGVNWAIIQNEDQTAVAGEWTWFDLNSSVATQYFRVVAISGTLGFSQIYLGNMPTEIPMARMNRDDYTNLPNKTFQSNRPLQFWLDRQAQSPVLNLWPVPNAQATTSQVVTWVQRYIMDVGTMSQQVEVPQRWYEALVAMLAAKMAMEMMGVDPQIIPMLDAKAAQALAVAQAEERDNSPIMIAPNISMYTR
ncbi:MAG: hypothetical protein RI988_2056 [Pseudomonadota bacterium]|jgi:hypothetical protein